MSFVIVIIILFDDIFSIQFFTEQTHIEIGLSRMMQPSLGEPSTPSINTFKFYNFLFLKFELYLLSYDFDLIYDTKI